MNPTVDFVDLIRASPDRAGAHSALEHRHAANV